MGFYEQFHELAAFQLDKIVQLPQSDLKLRHQWQEWQQNFASWVLQRDLERSTSTFDAVLDAKNQEHEDKLRSEELWAKGSFLMLAGVIPSCGGSNHARWANVSSTGFDTSATTLAGSLFYLSHCPEV